jgi:hypothetical protein
MFGESSCSWDNRYNGAGVMAMKCFVIMPFGNPDKDPDAARKLDEIYLHWIKPAIESVMAPDGIPVSCHRADKEPRPGDIISHIIENLVTADIVIADLTGQNPNVFYELGVRHAVQNNTILIAERLDDIPFDLRGQRTFPYSYTPSDMLKLKDSLEQAVRTIVTSESRIDNPVRQYLYTREIERISAPAAPPGYDAVRDILAEMANLKRDFRKQADDIRQLMEHLTTPVETDDRVETNDQEHGLSFFEGVWEDQLDGSTFYGRIVNGELLIAYCYTDNTWLTGKMYSAHLVGKTLFMKYRWFDYPIAGYIFMRVVDENTLTGGWWYDRDVPTGVERDFSSIDESIPGMEKSEWVRVQPSRAFPAWAEQFFVEAERQDATE